MTGAFDLEAALKAGATPAQIAAFLGQQYGYDTGAALKAGATPAQIAEHLAANSTQPAKSTNSYGVDFAQNALPDFWDLLKSVGTGLTHPIRSAEAIATPIAGGLETGLQALGVNAGKPKTQEQEAFRAFTQPIVESFQNPAGVPKRMLEYTAEKPAHALMNLSLLARGLGGVTKNAALKEIGTKLDPVNAAMKATGGAAKGLGFLGRQGLGFLTGEKYPNVNTVYQTFKKGGPAAENAREYLRGRLEGGDALEVYSGALEKMRDTQLADYTSRLKTIKADAATIIDPAPINNKLTQKLSKYDIKVGPKGELDFSRTGALRADSEAQAAITKAVDFVRDQGKQAGDLSPFGMDKLRQSLGGIYSPNSKALEFVADMKDAVKKGIIAKAPEYKTMLENFEKHQVIFEDSKKLFSIKNPHDRRVNADLVLKKLQRAMKEDNEWGRKFIETVEKETGTDIKSVLAAYSMSGALPSGIVGRGMLGGTMFTALRDGFGKADPHLALMMAAASPRAVGEFLNVAARTTRMAGTAKDVVRGSTTGRQAVTIAGEQERKKENR